MNRHTGIKIPLPRPHLDRHPEPLHHLTTAQPQNMHPHNPLLGALAHQLILRRVLGLLVRGVEVVVHGREAGVVGFDVRGAEARGGLRLRQPDGADFRVREDHRGDVGVVELRVGEVRPAAGVGATEEAIGEGAPGGDGD